MKLIVPTYAIRLKPHYLSGRKTYGRYHFQNTAKRNKTICKIIIADGRGWKYKNSASMQMKRRRERWERRNIDNVPRGQMCKTCLGAMEAE
jgi:hypothetical protein